jgi:chemotaxis response regulator CheB
MKNGRTSEAETFPQKVEETLVSHKSKAGSLSSEPVNLKLIPKTMKKPIAGKKTATTTVSKPARRNISTPRSFPIVGIGASAGGLEVFY